MPVDNHAEMERVFLGCVLTDSHHCLNAAAKLGFHESWLLPPHRIIYEAACELHFAKKPANPFTVAEHLKAKDGKKGRSLKNAGGLEYISKLPEEVTGIGMLGYSVEAIAERAELLWQLRRAQEIQSKIEEGGTPEEMRSLLMESASRIQTGVQKATNQNPRLVIKKCSERMKYQPPKDGLLVGDCEIRKGQEGLVILAGPGSSGKSLAAGSLALCGAIGSGTWMARQIHRQFRTLILQAEVGPGRMKAQIAAFIKNNPDVNLDDWIFYSDPPEEGMSIHDDEFWAAVSRQCAEIKPDLVIIDPWSHLGVQDDASEVMDALRKIRASVGVGENAPGILIVTHTRKPRDEKAARGRNLANIVSGSVCLVNTSRCTYILLPWDDENLEDQRVYFACPKLNDGANFNPTVWQRRFGAPFLHDPNTDPTTWGQGTKSERSGVTKRDLEDIYGENLGMNREELVAKLVEGGISGPTAYRITDPKNKQAYPFTKGWLTVSPGGLLVLKRR